jgi:hypothetical protein
MTGCGAPVGGAALDDVDLARTAVIQGVVARGDRPVAGAYVRLLDPAGEFTAEVPTSDDGEFRFFAAPGRWTVRTLAPRSPVADCVVEAALGEVTGVEVRLD